MNFTQLSTERVIFNRFVILILPALLVFLLGLAAPAPARADNLTIEAGACPGVSLAIGGATVACTAAQTPLYTAAYVAAGNLNGPLTGNMPAGTFGVEASVVQLPCFVGAPGGCGASVATALDVTYLFGGLGISSGMAQFNLSGIGSILGPNASAEFEVSPFESLIVNGNPVQSGTEQLPGEVPIILAIDSPIMNGATSLEFSLVASAFCSGVDACGSNADFFDPLTITGASAFDANGNVVPGATFVSESGFNPNGAAVATPEPSSLMLLGTGLLGLAGLAFKKAVA